ncbi:hypothetical protein Tco_0545500 [Tanacetum coccineum]
MYGYQSTDEYYADYDYWNTWVQDEIYDEFPAETDEEDEDEVMTTKDDDLLFYQDTFPVDKFVPYGKAMGSKRIEKSRTITWSCVRVSYAQCTLTWTSVKKRELRSEGDLRIDVTLDGRRVSIEVEGLPCMDSVTLCGVSNFEKVDRIYLEVVDNCEVEITTLIIELAGLGRAVSVLREERNRIGKVDHVATVESVPDSNCLGVPQEENIWLLV